MTAPQSPALPWGSSAPCAPHHKDAIRLDIGTRIEVLWQLDGEDESEDRLKWWPAMVEMVGNTVPQGMTGPVHTLRYEKSSEDGYDEEEHSFAWFPEKHAMVSMGPCDPGSGSMDITPEHLAWRLAGQNWEPPAAEEEEEGGTVGEEEGQGPAGLAHSEPAGLRGGQAVVRLQEIAAAIAERERLCGSSVDQECAEALGNLPPAQQRDFAAGFRQFTDAIMAGFASLTQEHGADYVITAADVERVNAQALQNLAPSSSHQD